MSQQHEHAPAGEPPRRGHFRWQFAPLALGILVLGGVILITLHFSEIEEIGALAQSAKPEWLLVALLTQGLTYVCATNVWRLALRRTGYSLPLQQLVPLGIAKLFTDQALPAAGIGGAALVVRALRQRQVPTQASMTALVVGLVSFYIAYLAVVLLAVLILWFHHRLSAALCGAVTIFGSFALGAPSLILYAAVIRKRSIPNWASRLPGARYVSEALREAAPLDALKNVRLMAECVALQLSIFFLDALTLWIAFKAIGRPIEIFVALCAFALASAAGSIGLVPLGLGTFEAGAVATLRLLGVSGAAALAATLLLRCFTFWLPMIPGIWIARREIARERTTPIVRPRRR